MLTQKHHNLLQTTSESLVMSKLELQSSFTPIIENWFKPHLSTEKYVHLFRHSVMGVIKKLSSW
jgi:hypothetical protein